MTAELVRVAQDPAALEAADPGQLAAMVTAALVESKSWLTVAMTGTDPTPIAEFKKWAVVVEEATRQKQLGREIELDAAEMVRRAERGLGVAIRNGQAAGEIATRGDVGGNGLGAHRNAHLNRAHRFFENHGAQTASSALAEAPDAQFDAAVAEARAEENLTRANVVRKVRGESPSKTTRPEHLRRTHHLRPERVISETVYGLEGFRITLDRLDPEHFTELNLNDVSAWTSSLTESIRALNRLNRDLKELIQA